MTARFASHDADCVGMMDERVMARAASGHVGAADVIGAAGAVMRA
jgi:hypothetical protein